MSDQGAPIQGPPDVVGPEGTPDTAGQATAGQEVNWQDRYQHLQPEYTRVTQENATVRQQLELYEQLLSAEDSDTQREIAEALGYRLDQEEEPESDEDGDPLVAYDERIRRLEESTQRRSQDEEQAAYAAEVRAVVDERLDQIDGLDKDDQDWVLAYAINALPITDEGLPDIEQAFQVFQQREITRQRAWAQTKRAPRISPNGQPGTEVPDLDDRQQRQDWMVRRLQDSGGEY